MSERNSTLICPTHICWLRDTQQIVVVNELTRQTYFLRGVEASVWEWLAAGCTYAALVEMMKTALATSTAEAATLLDLLISNWQKIGLLETASS